MMHQSGKKLKLSKTFEIALLSLALLVGFCASAIGAEEKKVQYLFVQSAHSVTFSGDTMTLHGVSPTTLFFSDRPERIAGHGSTEEYVKNWSKGDDSFAADPPNATYSSTPRIYDGDWRVWWSNAKKLFARSSTNGC